MELNTKADKPQAGGEEDMRIAAFEDIPDLSVDCRRGVYEYGFETPSPIQQRAIVPLMLGRDLIAQAPPGSGKTAAFLIPLMARLDVSQRALQALVLVPTRELAVQTTAVLRLLATHHLNGEEERLIATLTEYTPDYINQAYRGQAAIDEEKAVADGVLAAVGTPHRVAQLIKQGHLNVQHLKILVLDEADELMLSHDFAEPMDAICQKVPLEVQRATFSTTMPAKALEVARQMMRSSTSTIEVLLAPIGDSINTAQRLVNVSTVRAALDAIEPPKPISVPDATVTLTLNDYRDLRILKVVLEKPDLDLNQCVIFVSCPERATMLVEQAKTTGWSPEGLTVNALHEALTPNDQHNILRNLRSGALRIMVTTDKMYGRGLNVPQINVVVNFDLPCQTPPPGSDSVGAAAAVGSSEEDSKPATYSVANAADTYLHRLGRCGRYGSVRDPSAGTVISFVRDCQAADGPPSTSSPTSASAATSMDELLVQELKDGAYKLELRDYDPLQA